MQINPFKLEQYLQKYEFSAPYLLCCSDAESYNVKDILAMATPEDNQMWNKLRLGYTEVRGLPELRKTIADTLYNSDFENILCFSGAEEGIFCSLYALCEPEDHVIVLTPCYQSLKEIPKLKNAEVTEIQLQEINDWRIDLEAIKTAIRSNTKCVIINFPHNPTGQIITSSELKDLVTLLNKYGIWLFSDEAYRLLGNPSEGWSSPASVEYDKAISLGVMSKAYGMAGLRVGWIACKDKEILKKIEQIKHYTSICNSALSEIISLIAIKNQTSILARNNMIVSKNMDLLDSFFAKNKALFSWVRPRGGCIGYVNYNSNESIEKFSSRAVEKSGVLLLPASIYESNSNHFRIGFGRSNMPEALSKFEEFLTNENL